MWFCGSSPSGPTPGRDYEPPQTDSPASEPDMDSNSRQTTTLRFAGAALPEGSPAFGKSSAIYCLERGWKIVDADAQGSKTCIEQYTWCLLAASLSLSQMVHDVSGSWLSNCLN